MGNTKTEQEVDVLEDVLVNNVLMVYNDDVNTFEHVIDSLIKICKHSNEQASQCAMLIHTKEKCDVKHGDFDELLPMKRALNKVGITANIEEC